MRGDPMSVADLYEPDDESGSGAFAPPQDVAAEQSVLGAMLLSKNAIDPAADVLQGRDFYRPSHELIFDTITGLALRGEPADAITVAAELQRRGEVARVGGAPYLHTLVSGVSIAANVDYYAQIVREKAVLRRLIEVGQRIAQLGQAGQGELEDIVDRAQAEVLDVDGSRGADDYSLISSLIPTTIDEIEELSKRSGEIHGVPSGFPDLDRVTTGFRGGQMIVVAARPGIGKSTLGLDFCRAASIRHKIPSAIFSLEMTASEITTRLLSAEGKVNVSAMRGGQMSDNDWRKIGNVATKVNGAPIVIDDSPNMTMPEIRSKARRIQKEHGLGLLVIDYLQLMTSGKKVENRQVEVSEFSRQIKLLAKELDVPVIAISQLNRGSEQRTDKTPMISDLRESGSIEQDADVVLLLHRGQREGDEGGGESRERLGEADIIVAKNRSGPTTKVAVTFQGHYSRFTPMAHDDAGPPAAAAGDFF
jgi:replicative DNA helicase